jgi:hypothetical protein
VVGIVFEDSMQQHYELVRVGRNCVAVEVEFHRMTVILAVFGVRVTDHLVVIVVEVFFDKGEKRVGDTIPGVWT